MESCGVLLRPPLSAVLEYRWVFASVYLSLMLKKTPTQDSQQSPDSLLRNVSVETWMGASQEI